MLRRWSARVGWLVEGVRRRNLETQISRQQNSVDIWSTSVEILPIIMQHIWMMQRTSDPKQTSNKIVHDIPISHLLVFLLQTFFFIVDFFKEFAFPLLLRISSLYQGPVNSLFKQSLLSLFYLSFHIPSLISTGWLFCLSVISIFTFPIFLPQSKFGSSRTSLFCNLEAATVSKKRVGSAKS